MSSIDGTLKQAAIPASTGLERNTAHTIKQAGRQFEALLIAELLHMTHGDGESWLGSGEDSASSSAMGIAEDSLATALSAHGGFGLADLVVKNLKDASK